MMTERDVEQIAERVALRVMANWPRGYIDNLAAGIVRDIDGVERVRYDLKKDHDGEDAAFFRVLVSDDVCRGGEVREDVVEAVNRRMFEAFSALKLFPYVGWRSVSEQSRRRDKEWE